MNRREMMISCLAAFVPASVLATPAVEPLRIVYQCKIPTADFRYEADGTLTAVGRTITQFNRPMRRDDREAFATLVRSGHLIQRPGFRRISAAYDISPDGMQVVATYTDMRGFRRALDGGASDAANH